MEPEEKRAVALLQQIQALRKDKAVRRGAKKEEKRKEHRKEVAEITEKRDGKVREERRATFKKEGIKRKFQEEAVGGKRRK
jgi:ribosome biogenesis protein BMS1